MTVVILAAGRGSRLQPYTEDRPKCLAEFGGMTLIGRQLAVLRDAGIDDIVAEIIRTTGIEGLNHKFRHLLKTDPFALYNGPIGNAFRTKYRKGNWPLTDQGLNAMRESGMYAIVHGHRNILRGQRMIIRKGLLNFECDASVDRNTRDIEGLAGAGGAVTTLRSDGRLMGISTDFPYIKLFDPAEFGAVTTIV